MGTERSSTGSDILHAFLEPKDITLHNETSPIVNHHPCFQMATCVGLRNRGIPLHAEDESEGDAWTSDAGMVT